MWNPSDTLLTEYLAGYSADADACAVERWLTEDPANRARLEELQLLWQTPWPPVAADVETMWAELRDTVRAERPRPTSSRRLFQMDRPSRWRMPIVAAAAALLVAGGSLVILHVVRDTATFSATSMREYTTPRGQRATFQLPDGTRLILAAKSRLRLPADYGYGAREVSLDGEAYFEVVHDSARPFRVRAKGAVVEDLGTRFDVRAYAEDSAVAVAVAEGVVALGRADVSASAERWAGDVAQGVVLRQGELGILTPHGQVTTVTGATTDTYFAWTNGRLRFVETPLPEVLRSVGRWYDLDVRIGDPALDARTVTAEFTAQSPDDLVLALALALDARVHRSGTIVMLYPKS